MTASIECYGSEIVVAIILAQLLVELVGLLVLECLLNGDTAEEVNAGEEEPTEEELREECVGGWVRVRYKR